MYILNFIVAGVVIAIYIFIIVAIAKLNSYIYKTKRLLKDYVGMYVITQARKQKLLNDAYMYSLKDA